MGLLNSLEGQAVYLDTNVFIYALEDVSEFAHTIHLLFKSIDDGQVHAVTSELTLAETLVKPCVEGDYSLQRTFEEIIQSSETLEVVAVTRKILIAAAGVRAKTGLKLPDAIHIATAVHTDCAAIITNDRAIHSAGALRTLGLSELTR